MTTDVLIVGLALLIIMTSIAVVFSVWVSVAETTKHLDHKLDAILDELRKRKEDK